MGGANPSKHQMRRREIVKFASCKEANKTGWAHHSPANTRASDKASRYTRPIRATSAQAGPSNWMDEYAFEVTPPTVTRHDDRY